MTSLASQSFAYEFWASMECCGICLEHKFRTCSRNNLRMGVGWLRQEMDIIPFWFVVIPFVKGFEWGNMFLRTRENYGEIFFIRMTQFVLCSWTILDCKNCVIQALNLHPRFRWNGPEQIGVVVLAKLPSTIHGPLGIPDKSLQRDSPLG